MYKYVNYLKIFENRYSIIYDREDSIMQISVLLRKNWFRYLPSGQQSKTCCAISPADSFGLKRNSFVFPLTRMRRRFICNKKDTHRVSYDMTRNKIRKHTRF